MTYSDNNKNLIIVSRDMRTRRVLTSSLQQQGYACVEHMSPGDVMGALTGATMAIVVDVSADVDRGAAAVQRVANLDAEVPVVAISTDPEAWLVTLGAGAFDCAAGPIDVQKLVTVVGRAVEHRSLLLRVANLERKYKTLQNAVQDAMDEPPSDLEQQFGEGTDVHAVPSEADGKEVVPLRVLEERAIKHAMEVTNGSVTKAARLLGIGRATLYRRLANNADRN